MKIRRIFLFRLSAFLLSLLLVINPFGLGRLTIGKVNAQSAPRPYVVFVNGQGNCCAWGMTALRDRLASEFGLTRNDMRFVPYSNFRDGGQSGGGNQFDWSSVDTKFLRDGADFINKKLDKNRPLILIGHSFGGDSILSLIPLINRRIQFVAVIDPVAAGGLRQTIVQNRGIPSTVNYFFNRWQENSPWPVDFGKSGQVFSCEASSGGRRNCDQESQNIARNANFSPVTRECRWDEVTCPGFVAPNPIIGRKGRRGRAQVRVSHQDLPKDAYLQQVLGDRIIAQRASWRSSRPASPKQCPGSYSKQAFRGRTGQIAFFNEWNMPVTVVLYHPSNGQVFDRYTVSPKQNNFLGNNIVIGDDWGICFDNKPGASGVVNNAGSISDYNPNWQGKTLFMIQNPRIR